MKTKQPILTDKAPKAIGPYSQGIVCENFLFVSGQLPINPETGKIEGKTIKERAKQVFSNIKAIINASNANEEDIVKTTLFLTDMKDFNEINQIYNEYFTESYPARRKGVQNSVSVE
ncbi:MAG: hypothetical protein HUN05_07600 [Desulfobacter sp.]|nr:MAG: hypothetical protein HUN05_07600 [Desulfobacter sp.]